MKEIELTGGAVSGSVKIGDTVHRNAGPWTPAVHGLLQFLIDHGFDLVPRPLGMDPQGREILSFMPGKTALRPWPEVLKADDGLLQMSQLLRRYHDLVSSFVPPKDATWRIGKVKHRPGQIIRHGDLGPWNTLWDNGKLTALLDWDFAEPGERITDVAQMAWYFVPLRGEQGWKDAGFETRPDFRGRIRTLTEGYGDFSVDEVLKELHRLQQSDMEITQRLGGAGVYPWNKFYERGGMQILKDENAWLGVI
jgi:hypothetical protein